MMSCRTAQQARRNQSARGGSGGAQASGTGVQRANDSLLLIEHRLVEVIDSLSSLVQKDHTRLRALEQEIANLRARMYPGGYPSGSAQSYEPRTPDGQYYAAPPLPPAYAAPAPRSYTAPAPRSSTAPATRSYTAPATAPPVESMHGAPAPSNTMTPAKEYPAAPAPQFSAYDDRYVAARNRFMQNDFSSALDSFKALEHDDPHGALTVNYAYWQGESLYALKRYNEALQEFSLVVQEFPASIKADDAQFKIGECYERMGLRSSARAAYEKFLSTYPYSANRTRAEARLLKLRS